MIDGNSGGDQDHGRVSFRWKDYADNHRTKITTVSAEEFIRRLLLHVLPEGFVRIRHLGLLASVNVATNRIRPRVLEPASAFRTAAR